MIRFLTHKDTCSPCSRDRVRGGVCQRGTHRQFLTSFALFCFALLLGCETVNRKYGGVSAPYLAASYAQPSGKIQAEYGAYHPTAESGQLLFPALSPTQWNHFDDGQLLELISTAMIDNPSIEEMAWRIDGAKQRIQSVLAERHSHWEKDLHGRLVQAAHWAKADRQAAQEELNEVRRTLAGDIARAYITLRLNQELLKQNQTNLRVQRATLVVAEDRLASGEVTRLDLVQVESQIRLTESDNSIYQEGIEKSFHRLALLLGTTPNKHLSHLLLHQSQLMPEPIAAEAPAVLLRRRPDIRRGERQVASASALVGVAQAEALKFHAGPVEEKEIKVREASLRQAVARYRGRVLSAVSEVEDSLASQHRAHERVAVLTDAVRKAGLAVELALEQYAADQIPVNRLLVGERRLLASSTELARARAAAARASVDLFQALGGGDTHIESPVSCHDGFQFKFGFCE